MSACLILENQFTKLPLDLADNALHRVVAPSQHLLKIAAHLVVRVQTLATAGSKGCQEFGRDLIEQSVADIGVGYQECNESFKTEVIFGSPLAAITAPVV